MSPKTNINKHDIILLRFWASLLLCALDLELKNLSKNDNSKSKSRKLLSNKPKRNMLGQFCK